MSEIRSPEYVIVRMNARIRRLSPRYFSVADRILLSSSSVNGSVGFSFTRGGFTAEAAFRFTHPADSQNRKNALTRSRFFVA
ncbi:MAG: hypothetical protein A3I61_07910 [Acidobacteria bacterium RIFCSPLOWO2_02_FULL_68_18]|nr:MAG: hypothetical protein A3I61_07910 [Acidobacteria bacterium RIFCSPLOWO2_02_FULL_68_18]OFW51168.1 MAG: hypothetical protein A3G77_06010 [Acidobacteria bacterium RIFCSPLOWO2_12_FULL_68_19]